MIFLLNKLLTPRMTLKEWVKWHINGTRALELNYLEDWIKCWVQENEISI